MRLLLDTHAFLWWLSDDRQLGAVARAAIADGGNEVFVSAVSIWEAGIKKELGKLKAPAGLERIALDKGFGPLPITLAHAERAGGLPPHHRDPFDRMLVAQALIEKLTVVTRDAHFAAYGVKTLATG